VLVLGLVLLVAGRAVAAADPRELDARKEFAAGRYEAALDIFAKLYAETLHPVYLRNVARCYQNLKQPDRAITSFREYLRKAKNVTPADRAEVEGYIKEMEDLQKQQEAAAAAKPPANPVAPVTPLPASAPPPPQADRPPAVVVQAAPAAAPSQESSPIYARWWFWAAVAGVVAAGVGVAAAAGAFTKTQADPNCPDEWTCPN
jgi:tetratricopeptide (TPR) repeat protein